MCSVENIFLTILLLCTLIIEYDCASRRATRQVRVRSQDADDEVFLTEQDFRNADELVEDPGDIDSSLMYADDKFEGDIMMDGDMRSMTSKKRLLWPNKTIPYAISRKYNKKERAVMARAMGILQNETCLRFVPKARRDKAYLYIKPGGGCYTYLGKIGRKQPVVLSRYGCVFVGIVQHELMHTLGFYHEQSRYDRDDFIKILPNNIRPRMHSQFRKASKSEMNVHGERYDIQSIMQYDSMAFSRNRQPTMLQKNGTKIKRPRLANPNDYRKINKLYNCTSKL